MLMLFIYIALALYNTEVLALPLNDVRNFVDEFTVFPNEQGENLLDYVHRAPSGVWDLPITLVNEVLYDNQDDE
jgi:phosphatidylinositol glycan class P protein